MGSPRTLAPTQADHEVEMREADGDELGSGHGHGAVAQTPSPSETSTHSTPRSTS